MFFGFFLFCFFLSCVCSLFSRFVLFVVSFFVFVGHVLHYDRLAGDKKTGFFFLRFVSVIVALLGIFFIKNLN